MGVINISQVTTTLTTGDGVFDVLMRSVDAHLDKQYTSGRIKGTDYATVYLGSLTAVLQQAMAFVLAEQGEEKKLDLLDKEIALKTQQILTETQQTRLIDANSDGKEYEVANLMPRQVTQLDEQIDLLRTQEVGAQQQIAASSTDLGIKVVQSNKELEVKDEQISASQIASAIKQQLANKQESVYQKQSESYEKEYKYKVAKTFIDLRTTGMTQDLEGIKDPAANMIAKEMLTDVGLTFNAVAPATPTTEGFFAVIT